MILDQYTDLARNVTLPTATGRNVIGDQIDLGNVRGSANGGRPIGNGEALAAVITVRTAVTSGGAATVAFEIVSDDTAALATNGTSTLHGATEAIPVASLVAGFRRVIPLAKEARYERFLGVLNNVATAVLTAGAVDVSIVPLEHTQNWSALPAAQTF
jgi:hypothetical protein